MRHSADLLSTEKMWINEIESGSTKSTLNSVMKKDAKQKNEWKRKIEGGRKEVKI